MKRLIFGFIATLVVGTSAQARSLHPCTPTVPMQDSQVQCKSGANHISLKIKTLSSDPRRCPKLSDRREFKIGEFVVMNKEGKVVKQFDLFQDDFQVNSSSPSDATVIFRKDGKIVQLNSCVTPMHGGVSFGN